MHAIVQKIGLNEEKEWKLSMMTSIINYHIKELIMNDVDVEWGNFEISKKILIVNFYMQIVYYYSFIIFSKYFGVWTLIVFELRLNFPKMWKTTKMFWDIFCGFLLVLESSRELFIGDFYLISEILFFLRWFNNGKNFFSHISKFSFVYWQLIEDVQRLISTFCVWKFLYNFLKWKNYRKNKKKIKINYT